MLLRLPFAPPHEFGVNVPQIFAEIRAETYQEYSWPGILGKLYRRNGLAVGLITVLSTTLILLLILALRRDVLFSTQTGEGAFYRIVPYAAMIIPGAAHRALLSRGLRTRRVPLLARHG